MAWLRTIVTFVQRECQTAGHDVERVARARMRVHERALAATQCHVSDLNALAQALAAEGLDARLVFAGCSRHDDCRRRVQPARRVGRLLWRTLRVVPVPLAVGASPSHSSKVKPISR